MFKRDLDLERQWNQLLLEFEHMLEKKPKDLNAARTWQRSQTIQ